ncbi:unnamed protein product [Schistosoma curassoni]|uniref:DUF1771 domain-containing protein n=1 Tax=Schistosoma curassoni TaxID=6186 RepID=A0A183K722_9TREM|nr:unnamed protein product [Schistosoma curassoni]
MVDVRTRKGADIVSDHQQLVVAKIKLELEKYWATEQTGLQRFNTAFIRHTGKLNEFKEVLGCNKHHNNHWISVGTLDKIEEKKNKKTAINNSRTRAEEVETRAEYTEANKQMKKSIKADKQEYVEELATTAEQSAREGNMKQLYDTMK